MLLAESATIPEGEHQLQSPYCLWYSEKIRKGAQSFDQVIFSFFKNCFHEIFNCFKIFFLYLQNLQLLGSFASCEQFWKIYARLIRPGELTSHSDFHLFKKGIKPLWEVSKSDQKIIILILVRQRLLAGSRFLTDE